VRDMGEKKKDEIQFKGEIEPGVQAAIRRNERGEEQQVRVTFPEDGEAVPPGGELMFVDAECNNGWHAANTVYKSGPAQVATPEYREGYDRIFGKKTEVGVA